MKFVAQRPAAHSTVDPDPVAAPQNVSPALLMFVPEHDKDGLFARRLALTLDAGSAETATCDVYALDDSTVPGGTLEPGQITTAMLGARKFYLVKSGVVVTNHQIVVVPGPAIGWIYLRVTADTMATSGVLRAAGVYAGLVAS